MENKTEEDKIAKLRFDIALDILTSRVEEQEDAKKVADKKAHNEKIMALITNKQDESLANMSIEELTALLQ